MGESDGLLGTARSSRRLGASINCSPIAPCRDLTPVEDSAWRSVFDPVPSEHRRTTSESVPLHEKLRELLDENSRSFDQLRRRRSSSDAVAQAQKLKNTSKKGEEPSSSISFRRGSSRLSHGPEKALPVSPVKHSSQAPSVNPFEASDPPPIVDSEEALVEIAQAPPPRKRGRKPGKQRRESPSIEGKKTVKTKAGLSSLSQKRNRPSKKAVLRPSLFENAAPPKNVAPFFEVQPELRGITLQAEEGRVGRYTRRRRYAPLLDFLFENVTRNASGDIQLQIADFKVRPQRREPKRSKPAVNEMEGIAVESLGEDEATVVYRLLLTAGQVKPVAAAQLPLALRVEGRGKKCLVVNSGPDPRGLSRRVLDAGQTMEIAQNAVYGLENPLRRGVKISLTVFKDRG